jgi:hypothetical protein
MFESARRSLKPTRRPPRETVASWSIRVVGAKLFGNLERVDLSVEALPPMRRSRIPVDSAKTTFEHLPVSLPAGATDTAGMYRALPRRATSQSQASSAWSNQA